MSGVASAAFFSCGLDLYNAVIRSYEVFFNGVVYFRNLMDKLI